MAQANAKLRRLDTQSANGALGLLGNLLNGRLGLRVLLENLNVACSPLTPRGSLLLRSSHSNNSIHFNEAALLTSLARLDNLHFGKITNADRQSRYEQDDEM